MKKVIIFTIFSFIISRFLFSDEILLKVLNINGLPIENAEVRISEYGTVLLTDKNGECLLKIKEKEQIKLKVFHPLYYEKELTVKHGYDKIEIFIIPILKQREEVTVTATRYPELSIKLPVAGMVMTENIIEEKGSSTIEQVLTGNSGISSIGSGGYSKVSAIRGIARKRTLYLVENARIFSDRRTGPNASFVDPEEIERIEIIKSPLSVQYGSESMGGVIHTFLKSFPKKEWEGRINSRYGFNGNEKKVGFELGRRMGRNGFFFSMNYVDSEDYSSPEMKIPMSHYSRFNTFFRFGRNDEQRDLSAGILLSRGMDIGKPNIDSLTSPTYYPRENQNLLFLNWREKRHNIGEIFFHFSVNPNFIETLTESWKEYKTGETFARTQSIDGNLQISIGRNIFENLKISVGLDSFFRTNCNAINIYRNFSQKGELIEVTEEKSIKNGLIRNAGIVLTFDYWGFKPLDIVAGFRNDFFYLKADVSEPSIKSRVNENALTGFMGASFEIKENIFLFSNLSTAYRVPDLSERFYTGITGRGYIIGNPDLRSEKSFNIEGGVRIIDDKFYGGFYLFNYSMKNLVERYRKEGKIYSYENIDEGYLRGFEYEFEYFPVQGLKFFSNFHLIRGESKVKKTPLNDVPPPSLLLGSRLWKGKFWGELSCYIQRKHDRPGSSEVAISGFSVFNFRGGYYSGSKRIFLNIGNIFNRRFKARPDPDAMDEPGRSISVSFYYDFK